MKHGMSSKSNTHPIYHTWEAMKGRCFNSNDKKFPLYGGRGITVCDRWIDFVNFKNDMLPTWKRGLQLDRVDSEGNYELANCRWATRSEQARNKRDNIKINLCGYEFLAIDVAEAHGIDRSVFYDRFLRMDWDMLDACTIPKRKYS